MFFFPGHEELVALIRPLLRTTCGAWVWNWGILQIKEQRASQPSKNWMFSQKLSDKPILLKNNIKTSLFKDSMDLHCLCSPFYCASSGDSSATLQRKGSRIARKFRLALYRGVSNGESKKHTWWVRSTHLKKLNQLGIIPNSVYLSEKVETTQTTQPEYEWWATLFRYVNQGWSYQFANPNSNASWRLRSSGDVWKQQLAAIMNHPLGP